MFVDLTAAYHTVWHRDLTCKLLRMLPDRHMAQMIMEIVGNGGFTLTTGNGQRCRLRRLKNGVPQGSVLAPLLFNTYVSNLPTTISRKYAYADDLATALGSSELLLQANFPVVLTVASLFFETNNGCGNELSPIYRYRYSLLCREWWPKEKVCKSSSLSKR